MSAESLPIPEFWSFDRSRDAHLITKTEAHWLGPFGWPGFEPATVATLPEVAGVYLATFEYRDGFILQSVGVSNDVRRRMRQHGKSYLAGEYTILDVSAAKAGLRRERWHGWAEARANIAILKAHGATIRSWAMAQLEALRLFVLVEPDKRLRERVEFALLHSAYGSCAPWGDLIDGGMHMRGRVNREVPRILLSRCRATVYGLPESIEV
jgi:hypothetical protein